MSKNPAAPHICFDRIIPEHLDPNAEKHKQAVSRYLSALKEKAIKNGKEIKADATFADQVEAAGGTHELSATDGPINVVRMALVDAKKWDPGHILTCKFLDGDKSQHTKVMKNAKIWEGHADIKIKFGEDPKSQVRISFVADPGSWSAIGQDCLVTSYFPLDQPTMN
ncbi:MAG TPA: hypothetical protein VGP65_05645, partial [Candidatus Angelobacter sp.]|nr:hypothetical protein [Candidatus Angelobacter sp.]